MRDLRWLAALPFIGILAGSFFLDRVEPYVLGMPLLLAWLVLCVVGTSAAMAAVYAADPENRNPENPGGRR